MGKMIGCAAKAAFLVLVIFAGGCGQSDTAELADEQLEEMIAQESSLPSYSGGMSLVVAGEVISADEIIEPLTESLGTVAARSDFDQFSKYARLRVGQVVRAKAAEALLFEKAKKELPDNADEALAKAVEQEVQGYIAGFGGNYAAAEKKLRENGWDWESFRRYKKRLILTQNYLGKRVGADKPITHSQLLEHYEVIKHKDYFRPGRLQFSLIDITPEPVADANQANIERAELEARRLAEELAARVRSGEDFAGLAREYSKGHRASAGGLWEPVQPGSLAEPYDVIEESCQDLSPGEIAGPVESGGHIFIIKLKEKQTRGFFFFFDVQQDVQKKFVVQQRRETLSKLMAQFEQQVQGPNLEKFVDFCLYEIYRRKGGMQEAGGE